MRSGITDAEAKPHEAGLIRYQRGRSPFSIAPVRRQGPANAVDSSQTRSIVRLPTSSDRRAPPSCKGNVAIRPVRRSRFPKLLRSIAHRRPWPACRRCSVLPGQRRMARVALQASGVCRHTPEHIRSIDVRQRHRNRQSAAQLQQGRMLGSLQELRLVPETGPASAHHCRDGPYQGQRHRIAVTGRRFVGRSLRDRSGHAARPVSDPCPLARYRRRNGSAAGSRARRRRSRRPGHQHLHGLSLPRLDQLRHRTPRVATRRPRV